MLTLYIALCLLIGGRFEGCATLFENTQGTLFYYKAVSKIQVLFCI